MASQTEELKTARKSRAKKGADTNGSLGQKAFDTLLAAGATSGPELLKIDRSKDEKAELNLSSRATELDQIYTRAFNLAEEKGPNDREVLSLLSEVEKEWPAHPGIVENQVNDLIESGETSKAAEVAKSRVNQWFGVLKSSGIKSASDLNLRSRAGHLLVQVLANYEFALERDNQLQEALQVAILAKELDPTDPENILSAIIGLMIRTGDAMSAIRELEALQDSLAPYVLYGRALAYFALGQRENASGAIQNALRHWPQVAQSVTREWKGGTPMPKPGEAVSELQVLYGYYEVFGSTWKSVSGAIEWLKEEEQQFNRAGGARQQRYIGLTRSGLRTDAHGNIIHDARQEMDEKARAKEQQELIRKAQLIGENEFVRFLEVRPNEFVYDITERGEELEEEHNELYRKDMKLQARIDAIQSMLAVWPGHANAAVALARYYGQKERFEDAIEVLQPAIFALQQFWSEDLVGTGRISSEWPGNKALLTAYAYIVLYCAEAGDHVSAKAFAADYLQINPLDNMGVRQKAIELYIADGEFGEAMNLINQAPDQASAYNLFGRALVGFAAKASDAELALKTAVENRPLVWREMTAEKHRMPHNYNPSFVHYLSPEEAYNYQQTWSGLWMKKYGALAWLKKEGRKYMK